MKYLINFIQSFFVKSTFLGVAKDTRSQEVKELDPVHEEVAGGLLPITWSVKNPETWKKYTLRNQNLSSSDCVMFSSTTGIEADRGLSFPLSAYDLYEQRSNYPEPGTIPMEGVSIPCKNGVLPDSLLPSDNLTEAQLNTRISRTPEMLAKAKELSGGIGVKLTTIDIDTIAGLISQGMTVRLCFHFTLKEWAAIPQILSDGNIHHQVIGVDWSIVNGKKCIIIQDSCFPNSTYVFPHGLRAITEDFLLSRCFSATYIRPTSPVSPLPAPQHIFTVDMGYGDSNNEVLLLQIKLHSLGFFNVTPTGYFGGLTKQAVIAYQTSKGISATGYVGPITRASLT